MTTQPSSDNRQIARAAGIVMGAIVFSQVIGLLAKSLAGSAYGTQAEMDAFFAANQFTDLLFNLVAAGALSSAFIPVFTTHIAREEHKQAWLLASAIANLVTLILTLLSIITAIFAPQVVRHILATGFTDPTQQALTVDLLRIQLVSTIIFGLSGLLMAILNAHQYFLFPALAPSMYSFGWIIGVLFLRPSLGIYGLAWGAVAGACLHLLVQVPVLFRLKHRKYHFTLGLKFPSVREVASLMGPRLLGVSIVQLNFLFNAYLASFLSEGSYSSIKYALTLMLMPQAAIAQSIAIASLPTFSAQVARGERDQMRASLAATLRGVLLLSLPASVGLVMMRSEIVSLVFERIQFDASSTQMVAWALLWYGAGLVGHSIVEIISRAFYALHDTKTPVFVGIDWGDEPEPGLQPALHHRFRQDWLGAARGAGAGQLPGDRPGEHRPARPHEKEAERPGSQEPAAGAAEGRTGDACHGRCCVGLAPPDGGQRHRHHRPGRGGCRRVGLPAWPVGPPCPGVETRLAVHPGPAALPQKIREPVFLACIEYFSQSIWDNGKCNHI
jgi:putative peptidoglycan lipid II flippase